MDHNPNPKAGPFLFTGAMVTFFESSFQVGKIQPISFEFWHP